MDKFDKSKYSNHSDAVLLLEDKKNALQNLLVTLVFEYANKISGTDSNREFIDLRNSIMLRLDSVFYHYNLLASINVSGEEFISDQPISLLETKQIAIEQDFLFDSIIFNTLSLFDYTSCLIEFVTENKKRKLWKQFANNASSKAGFRETSLAKLIVELNRKWVSKLVEYRAELIHYNDDFVSDSLRYYHKEEKYMISISVPLALKKYFKEFRQNENLDANINEATLWIIDNSIECISSLIKELITHFSVIRKVPLGKEVYTFGEQK